MSDDQKEFSGWKAYPDADRTASNAYDAAELNFSASSSFKVLEAIKIGVLMERQRCARIAESMATDYYGDPSYEISKAILNQTEE
jgi:hypothetical protein